MIGLFAAGAVGAAGSVVGATGGVWSPTQIGGLVLWLRGDLGVTLNTTRVSAWADQSGAGNHFTQAGAVVQPTFIASETDFPTARPAVKFDITSSSLISGAVFANIAWIGVVGVYPGTVFGNFNGLIEAGVSGVGQTPLRGDSGAATWRVSTGPAGTRYRDGTATNTALTTANTPHFWECVPTAAWTPTGGIVRLGCDDATAGREWSDSVAEVFMATSVPSAGTLTSLRAYLTTRYGFAA